MRTWPTGFTTDSRRLGRASASNRFVPDKRGGRVAEHYGCRELIAAYCAFNPSRLRYNTLSSGNYSPTFRTIVQCPFSGSSSPVCGLCDNRTEFLNVSKRLPVHAEFQTRIFDSSSKPLREPHISRLPLVIYLTGPPEIAILLPPHESLTYEW